MAKNTAYSNKFYVNLLRVAREYAGSYTIFVNKISDLAVMMEMPYTDKFHDEFVKFGKGQRGFTKQVKGGYIIEVLPF